MAGGTVLTPSEKDLMSRLDHVESIVVKMSGKMEKIYDVVVGNETFDQEGLIARIKKLENESKKLNALKKQAGWCFHSRWSNMDNSLGNV